MDKLLSFKEVFDRMTEVYIHGKVNAYDVNFCWCGNLTLDPHEQTFDRQRMKVGEFPKWITARNQYIPTNPDVISEIGLPVIKTVMGYTGTELGKMELAYMHPITNNLEGYKMTLERGEVGEDADFEDLINMHNRGEINIPGHEDANYDGFVAALNVLREIHIARGEDVDLSLKFTKKEQVLVPA